MFHTITAHKNIEINYKDAKIKNKWKFYQCIKLMSLHSALHKNNKFNLFLILFSGHHLCINNPQVAYSNSFSHYKLHFLFSHK